MAATRSLLGRRHDPQLAALFPFGGGISKFRTVVKASPTFCTLVNGKRADIRVRQRPRKRRAAAIFSGCCMTSLPIDKHTILTGCSDHRFSDLFRRYRPVVCGGKRSLGRFIGFAGFLLRPFVQQEVSGALGAVDRDGSAEMFCFQRQSFIPPLCWHGFVPPEEKPAIGRFVPGEGGMILLDIIRLKLQFRRARKKSIQ
jgi:hypothetical protein